MNRNTDAGEPTVSRVLIVDDQAAVREAVALLLGLYPGIEVVGSAADGVEALHLAAEHRPDVVLMDLHMPRMNGVEATRLIRAEHPATQVLVFTTYADDAYLRLALDAGARSHLTKGARADEIRSAIAAAHAGTPTEPA